jgi:hypothetical protein
MPDPSVPPDPTLAHATITDLPTNEVERRRTATDRLNDRLEKIEEALGGEDGIRVQLANISSAFEGHEKADDNRHLAIMERLSEKGDPWLMRGLVFLLLVAFVSVVALAGRLISVETSTSGLKVTTGGSSPATESHPAPPVGPEAP